jgi:hypothetical protein
MGIRRADSSPVVPAPTARGVAPSDVAPAASPPVGSRARDSFQAARAAPMALDAPAAGTQFQRPSDAGEWTLSAQGQKADPVTIYVHGSLSQLEDALTSTGWTQADPSNLASDVEYGVAAAEDEALKGAAAVADGIDDVEEGVAGLFGRRPKPLLPEQAPTVAEVNEMPVSPQTYQGQPLVAAYECDNDPLGGRNHLRIFDTGKQDAQGQEVYAIAASRDASIRFAPDHPETGFLFHNVDPNVAAERDLVLRSLQQSGRVATTEPFTVPFGGGSTYGEAVSDSKAYDVTLQRRE